MGTERGRKAVKVCAARESGKFVVKNSLVKGLPIPKAIGRAERQQVVCFIKKGEVGARFAFCKKRKGACFTQVPWF